jgi:hypothetical protein
MLRVDTSVVISLLEGAMVVVQYVVVHNAPIVQACRVRSLPFSMDVVEFSL